MPKAPVPQHVADFLAKPNHAVISTVRPDGQPVSVATWYLYEDGKILVNMDHGRKRLEFMRANPLASVTVLDKDNWYTHVSLTGRIVRLEDDPDLAAIDRIAAQYGSAGYPVRDRLRISAWIEIDSWHAWQLG